MSVQIWPIVVKGRANDPCDHHGIDLDGKNSRGFLYHGTFRIWENLQLNGDPLYFHINHLEGIVVTNYVLILSPGTIYSITFNRIACKFQHNGKSPVTAYMGDTPETDWLLLNRASLLIWINFNTLRPRQNSRDFADDIFKCIFLGEIVWFSITISLKFVPKGPIDNIPALVQIMAWRRPGDKPLSELMMVSLLTHICVTRPQWVNTSIDK